MKMLLAMLIVLLLLFASGCSKLPDQNESIDPNTLAVKYAKDEGVNLSEYRSAVIKEYRNGDTSVLDRRNTDEYTVSFLEDLKGEDYWEACYQTKELMLGGEYCFYISKENGSLLQVYRSQ
jgi:hypothetical protein